VWPRNSHEGVIDSTATMEQPSYNHTVNHSQNSYIFSDVVLLIFLHRQQN